MHFELTESQARWQEAAIEFARGELRSPMIERDREETFDRAGWDKCAGFGVHAMPIAEENGGLGLSLSDGLAVFEGLGYACPDQGLLFSIHAHLWTNSVPIELYGTEEQKARFLPRLCSGELIGANGATEPESGSDVYAMRTRAERRGDRYVLNGTKMFVTNAQVADLIVAYATIDPALGPLGVTAFIVERDTPGISVSRPISKMGLRTSPMGEVVLEDVEVPVENRLGREGRGAEVFQCSMEWERGCIMASCLGAMRRQLESCIGYVRTRKQFGQAIGKFQSVANRVVDMRVRLDTSRPLVYRIGWLKERGKDALLEASIAKLHVSECYVQSSLDAVQVYGGYGFTTEQELERDVRDALGSRLYSGTSEIQRTIIARCLRI